MNRIESERKNIGLTQEKLAQEMGVCKQTVSEWETNNRVPKRETLQKLAKRFGVSVDYLLGFSDTRQNTA